MHQSGKTRHQSRRKFDWFGCVSPLLVARLCSIRLSLALLRKRSDMRPRGAEAGCQRQEMQPDHGHCRSRLALRQPRPGEQAGATAVLGGHVVGQRRVDTPSRRLGMFNVLGMAVEVVRGSIGSVDARQSRRAKGGGLPRCNEWRARATNRLYACVNAIPDVHRRARCYVVENRHRNGVAERASTFTPRGVSWRADC
jgi:hypothetical protein